MTLSLAIQKGFGGFRKLVILREMLPELKGSEEAHRLGLIPANIDLPDGMKLYVLHAEDGSVLGFTDGYASAYGAAVQNQLTPVSLH